MKKIYLTCLLAVTASHAQASGIPTVDVANILQTTRSAMENIQQTLNQYEQIVNQVKQIESMTGNYGMGDLLKSQLQQLLRARSSSNWEETLAIYEAGGLPGHQEAHKEAQAARAAGEYHTASDLYDDPDSRPAKSFEYNAKRIYSTMGVSRATYNQTGQRLENIEQLNENIEKATNVKSAIDLNNRLSVENAVLINELVRQIAILNIQQTEQRELMHSRKAGDMRMADGTIPDFGGDSQWLKNHD